jgi:homeobox-leucine zipper protein
MNFGGMFDGAGSGVFSYDAGGGAGTHNPGGRLIPKPGGGFASPGLSLGLVCSLS